MEDKAPIFKSNGGELKYEFCPADKPEPIEEKITISQMFEFIRWVHLNHFEYWEEVDLFMHRGTEMSIRFSKQEVWNKFKERK